jgi:hypothetical protein
VRVWWRFIRLEWEDCKRKYVIVALKLGVVGMKFQNDRLLSTDERGVFLYTMLLRSFLSSAHFPTVTRLRRGSSLSKRRS